MTIEELEKRMKKAKRFNKTERLEELRDIAEEIANDFTYAMSFLEPEIEDALYNTGDKIKDELGYHDVSDVTQDICVTNSNGF